MTSSANEKDAKDYVSIVRASVDGHRFHWYWTAHESLNLLDPARNIARIGVEGLDESNPVAGEEIADVVRYFRPSIDGSENAAKQIVQIKYATKNADTPYGWDYLKKSIIKFAELYKARRQSVDEPVANHAMTFLFLSNRPAAEKFRKFFDRPEQGSSAYHPFILIKTATVDLGLTDIELLDFANLCAIEDNASLIDDVVFNGKRLADEVSPGDGNAFTHLFELMAAKAGSGGERNRTVNKQDVLKAFGVYRERQLFPATPHFEPVSDLLPRPEVAVIREKIAPSVSAPIIITAEGGVGKTVFMQQISDELSDRHETVIFDCFAGGRYRNDADRRHLPENALTQIVNELSLRGENGGVKVVHCSGGIKLSRAA